MKVIDKKQTIWRNQYLWYRKSQRSLCSVFCRWILFESADESEGYRVFFNNVTFEPGCRNNWHIHHAQSRGGQLLICTVGEGWYQEENKAPVSLREVMVITIPAEVKHWHGVKADSWFSHIAVEIPDEETSNEWCEPVNDEEYDKLEVK